MGIAVLLGVIVICAIAYLAVVHDNPSREEPFWEFIFWLAVIVAIIIAVVILFIFLLAWWQV